jgi:HNH endonuclease
MKRKLLSENQKKALAESRNRCAICGAEAFLEIEHVKPFYEGGETIKENLIVLCPTCHMAVDSSQVPSEVLQEIKNDWINNENLGMAKILKLSKDLKNASRAASSPKASHSLSNLLDWSEALKKKRKLRCLHSVHYRKAKANHQRGRVHQ